MAQRHAHWRISLGLLAAGLASAQAAEIAPEKQLLDALQAMQSSRIDTALQELQGLVDTNPQFKLAQLVYADALSSKSLPLDRPAGSNVASDRINDLLEEAQVRWQAKAEAPPPDSIPSALLRLDKTYRHMVAIDLQQSRLYVFSNQNGSPKLIRDFYVSMGRNGPKKEVQGDLRSPLGVYFIESHIPREKLPPLYGEGAYPINYPNAWDQRMGRTGYGIWLHGTPFDTYSRPPRASEGCLVLSNSDLIELGRYVDLKRTPVIIGTRLHWLDQAQWQQQQDFFAQMFEQWHKDWESRDVARYLSHYSTSFDNGKKDYATWAEHKQRVTSYKKFIQVGISDMSILAHPDEDVVVMTFQQDFRSDTYSSKNYKRQYWHKEDDGQWRIIFEDVIPDPA